MAGNFLLQQKQNVKGIEFPELILPSGNYKPVVVLFDQAHKIPDQQVTPRDRFYLRERAPQVFFVIDSREATKPGQVNALDVVKKHLREVATGGSALTSAVPRVLYYKVVIFNGEVLKSESYRENAVTYSEAAGWALSKLNKRRGGSDKESDKEGDLSGALKRVIDLLWRQKDDNNDSAPRSVVVILSALEHDDLRAVKSELALLRSMKSTVQICSLATRERNPALPFALASLAGSGCWAELTGVGDEPNPLKGQLSRLLRDVSWPHHRHAGISCNVTAGISSSEDAFLTSSSESLLGAMLDDKGCGLLQLGYQASGGFSLLIPAQASAGLKITYHDWVREHKQGDTIPVTVAPFESFTTEDKLRAITNFNRAIFSLYLWGHTGEQLLYHTPLSDSVSLSSVRGAMRDHSLRPEVFSSLAGCAADKGAASYGGYIPRGEEVRLGITSEEWSSGRRIAGPLIRESPFYLLRGAFR